MTPQQQQQQQILQASQNLFLLGLAFVILKLCGVIGWSWWWVTCPFWAGLAVAALILLGIGVCLLAVAITTGVCVLRNWIRRNKSK